MSYYPGSVRGNPFVQGNPFATSEATAPERLPVRTSTLTHCETCQKQVWTEVRRVRAGIKRTGATDAMFHVISVAFVHIETEYNHYCPHCGRRFEIYRLVGHKTKQQGQRPKQHGVPSLAPYGTGPKYPGEAAARGYLGGASGQELRDKPIPEDSPGDPLPPYTERRIPAAELRASQMRADPRAQEPDQESVTRLLPSRYTREGDDQSFVSASMDQVSLGH